MPRNAIIKKDQHKSQQSRSCCHKGHPRLAIDITEVHNPRSVTIGSFLSVAFIWPTSGAASVTTLKGRRNLTWHIKLFDRNVCESIPNQRPNQNTDYNSEIRNCVAARLIGQEWREFELAKLKGHWKTKKKKKKKRDLYKYIVIYLERKVDPIMHTLQQSAATYRK